MTGCFWEDMDMDEFTREEWESVCDGCARCCVFKLRDEESGDILYTDVACALLDLETCRCSHYENRRTLVPECVVLTPGMRDEMRWLPETCAYRLLSEGKALPSWHPLITGNPDSTRDAGMSVRNRVVPESEVEDVTEHVVDVQSCGRPRDEEG